MADRHRTTWPGGGNMLPVERAASAHPATPDEGPGHPAYQPDPGPNDYANGDPSAWAEDPTKGPYPNSAHPATPDEGPGHPAYKAAARDIRAAVEQRAAKCIRIAQQLLGARATVAAVEDQALHFMHLSDTALTATLNRLGGKKGEDEPEDKDEPDEAKDEKEKAAAKKAADDAEKEEKEKAEKEKEEGKTASASALDQILSKLGGIETRLATLEVGGKPATAAVAQTAAMDEESVLAALLAEEGMSASAPKEADEVEGLLNSMLSEEGIGSSEFGGDFGANEFDEFGGGGGVGLDIEMGMGVDDPMGMMDGGDMLDDGDAAMLSQLYASDGSMSSRLAADEDPEPEPEPEDDKKGKTAGQRPRPKKASAGASRLGGFTREAAAAASEIADLEKLWPTSPDVSKNFG